MKDKKKRNIVIVLSVLAVICILSIVVVLSQNPLSDDLGKSEESNKESIAKDETNEIGETENKESFDSIFHDGESENPDMNGLGSEATEPDENGSGENGSDKNASDENESDKNTSDENESGKNESKEDDRKNVFTVTEDKEIKYGAIY